jgi:hypothetical protein
MAGWVQYLTWPAKGLPAAVLSSVERVTVAGFCFIHNRVNQAPWQGFGVLAAESKLGLTTGGIAAGSIPSSCDPA